MRSIAKNHCFTFIILSLLIFGCNGNHGENVNSATENLSPMEEMRFKQYMVYGQQLYSQHCSNCHQIDGSGLKRLIPPLAASDYMLNNIDRTVCIISNGLEESIRVNGEEYQQKMPSNPELTALEIAQITTYIANSWGNSKGYISVKKIVSSLEKCP